MKYIEEKIAQLKQHSKMSAEIAQGQLDLLVKTNADASAYRGLERDVIAALQVWQ